MLYAIAAICLTLVILALVGKPIRIEIIHTVTPQPVPPEAIQEAEKTVKSAKEVLDVMAYVNEVFHNVEKGDSNG